VTANPKRARLFHNKAFANEDIYRPFLKLLQKKNWFIQEKSCKILTLVISARPNDEGEIDDTADSFSDILRSLVDWLISQLRTPSHPTRGIPMAVSSLATLLRLSKVRAMFVRADGIRLLAPLITPAVTQQHIQVCCPSLLSVTSYCNIDLTLSSSSLFTIHMLHSFWNCDYMHSFCI
jgi:V-type H+-transporting ATPase subunit H